MNRRGFLATLAGLPFVGWLFKHEEPKPWVPFSVRNGYQEPTEEQKRQMELELELLQRWGIEAGESLIQLDCGACGTRFVRKVPTSHVSRIVAGSPRCRACHARDERQALYRYHGSGSLGAYEEGLTWREWR